MCRDIYWSWYANQLEMGRACLSQAFLAFSELKEQNKVAEYQERKKCWVRFPSQTNIQIQPSKLVCPQSPLIFLKWVLIKLFWLYMQFSGVCWCPTLSRSSAADCLSCPGLSYLDVSRIVLVRDAVNPLCTESHLFKLTSGGRGGCVQAQFRVQLCSGSLTEVVFRAILWSLTTDHFDNFYSVRCWGASYKR